MGNGKKGIAPCGHVGEAVIGHYYQCATCDIGSIPEHIEPEHTEPLCPKCQSDDIEMFQGFHLNGTDVWFCNGCHRVFEQ